MSTRDITLTVNGRTVTVSVEPRSCSSTCCATARADRHARRLRARRVRHLHRAA